MRKINNLEQFNLVNVDGTQKAAIQDLNLIQHILCAIVIIRLRSQL